MTENNESVALEARALTKGYGDLIALEPLDR